MTPSDARALIRYGLVGLVLTFFLASALYLVRGALLLIYISTLIAIGLSPIVTSIQRLRGRRAPRLPRWVEFFLAFYVEYRRRRLHFLIEGQNRLYRLIDEGRFPGLDPVVVDRDEHPRETTLEALGKLKPIVRPDGVTSALLSGDTRPP